MAKQSKRSTARTALQVETLAKHQFKPGDTGNPAGRPRLPPELITKLRGCCPEVVDRLIELTSSHEGDIALRACEALLNRAYGKPRETVGFEDDGADVHKDTPELLKSLPHIVAILTARQA